MLFERILSAGISHNSYLIGSRGEAMVIDPRRDCEDYIRIARDAGMEISLIFETHRNEDYVSGAPELGARTGAGIYHGARTSFAYGHPVSEGDRFVLGSIEIRVLETPGHTEESISLVCADRKASERPYMVFTGDTLFSGEIGRTDLLGEERKGEMAAAIHDSIFHKILPLGDSVIICPAHGAGSVCGAEIGDLPFTTIGYERATNRALIAGRDAFIRQRIAESPYFPPYFRQMEQVNQEGAAVLHRLPHLPILPVPDAERLIESGCQIVDLRSPSCFGAGHIPGSLSLWRDGLPSYAGWFLEYERPVLIVDDFNTDPERIIRYLIRLGYDSLAGIIAGGFPAWTKAAKEIGRTATCSALEAKDLIEQKHPFILDVRSRKSRHESGHIPGSHHVYVGELPAHLDEIPRDQKILVYCDAGFKGSLAASVLAMNRYTDVTNLLGGMTAWKAAGYPAESD